VRAKDTAPFGRNGQRVEQFFLFATGQAAIEKV
jgi:hypothetical protein